MTLGLFPKWRVTSKWPTLGHICSPYMQKLLSQTRLHKWSIHPKTWKTQELQVWCRYRVQCCHIQDSKSTNNMAPSAEVAVPTHTRNHLTSASAAQTSGQHPVSLCVEKIQTGQPIYKEPLWAGHWPQGSTSHWPLGSTSHWPLGSTSHWPQGSTSLGCSHWPQMSTSHGGSYWPQGSTNHWCSRWPQGSISHWPQGSTSQGSSHWPQISMSHWPQGEY